MFFDYFESVRSSEGVVCTSERLLAATHSASVAKQCSAIALCDTSDLRGTLKKALPVVTWQAHFPSGKRKNSDAVPSGLFMLDLDHVDEPNKLYYSLIAPRLDELGIMVVHKTPSAKGLRVVARCRPEFTSIGENQQWLASVLGVDYDVACSDLARASFLVPEEYFYYRDGRIFTDTMPDNVKILEGKPSVSSHAGGVVSAVSPSEAEMAEDEAETAVTVADDSAVQTHYKGFSLVDIAAKWLAMHGGQPVEGERNTVLFQLANRLRYITDFDYRAIYSAIPHCGLPDDEVLRLCQSACNGSRSAKMPWDLTAALDALQSSAKGGEDREIVNSEFLSRMPSLPLVLSDTLDGVPDKAVLPVLCGIMPLCMAYATRVSYLYCDGAEHRLNGMAVIYGPQGSGKSIVREAVDLWISPMTEADAKEREVENDYREKRRNRRADEALPPEPKTIIRNVPITISCSALLKRMMNAEGRHIYSFGEELDTLSKSNRSGAWSEKTDCYRLSFDNGDWGQDYLSDGSVSGLAKVCYNFSVLGTLGAVYKYFSSTNAENGLCSRILFAEMVNNPYEYLTKRVRRDVSKRRTNILRAVEVLSNASGLLELPRLSGCLENWCNSRADEAQLLDDKVVDTFRKRSAIIAYRCAVVFYLLENADAEVPVESDNLLAFAELMADYCLYHQAKLFGSKLSTALETHAVPYVLNTRMNYLDCLGTVFTIDDMCALRSNASMGAIRTMISRWKTSGRIEELDSNKWRKVSV